MSYFYLQLFFLKYFKRHFAFKIQQPQEIKIRKPYEHNLLRLYLFQYIRFKTAKNAANLSDSPTKLFYFLSPYLIKFLVIFYLTDIYKIIPFALKQ